MSVRDEFEAWRQMRVAQLERKLQQLTPRAPKAAAIPRDVEEEVGRALEDFLRRNHCVRGTLELTRELDRDSDARFDSVVYGTGDAGQLESFFQYASEPFLSLAQAFLEQHNRLGKLTVEAETSPPRYTAKLEQLSGGWLRADRDERDRLGVERQLTGMRALSPDDTPYGEELARRVVQRLEQGKALAHSHRDYCGMGLFPREGGGFVYTSVVDGGYDASFVQRAFDSAQALLDWLAQQSNLSLSGYGDEFTFLNQRLTRERLEEFARQA